MHTECAQKINVKTRFFCIFTALCKKQIFFIFLQLIKNVKMDGKGGVTKINSHIAKVNAQVQSYIIMVPSFFLSCNFI